MQHLSSYAYPVKVRRPSTSHARNANGVGAAGRETCQLNRVSLENICGPVVPAERKADRLRGAPVDADGRQPLIVAASQITDVTVDVVEQYGLRAGLGRRDVGQHNAAVGGAAEVADLIRGRAARAGLQGCAR